MCAKKCFASFVILITFVLQKQSSFEYRILKLNLMDKCKCIKKYDDTQVSFSENYFYDYDYIPNVASYPAAYRVYHDLKAFRKFSLIEFKQYFKRY